MNDKFIKIFNLYKNDVYRLAYSYTKNKSDTDDIAQNVFIKLYKHKDILRLANDDIKKWLFKVTINECKSLFLSHWRIKVSLFDDKDIKVSDSNNDLLDVIANLNKKERIIVFLHYYEGYKIKEIAEMMKLSEVNVKVLLSRTRKKLKNMMEASVPNVYHLKGKIGFYFTLMYSLTLNTPHFVGRYFIQIYYS